MNIEKYKYLGENKYEINLVDDKIILYEDIIIKYNILLKKSLTKEELKKYLSENKYYEIYYDVLKYINKKIRSTKQIENYIKNYTYDEDIITSIVNKIKKEGYLNDTIYTKSYIHDVISFKMDGPLKIKKHLEDLSIDNKIIKEELSIFSQQIIDEKIKKYVDKQLKNNKNKSLYIFKEQVINYLINLGYEKEDILRCLSNISFDEENIYKKEYEKIYKKLSLKYSGKELEYKVKQKMYQKGFKNYCDF